MTKKVNVTFHSDPGHGWLAVKISLLQELGLEDKISGYSYMKGKTAYLEEDGDASLFMKSAKEKGYEVTIKRGKMMDTNHAIRSYGRFDKGLCDVKVGDVVYQMKNDNFLAFKVLEDDKVVSLDTDQIFRVPRSDYPKYFMSSVEVEKIKEKRRKEESLRNMVKAVGIDPDSCYLYDSFGIRVPGGFLNLNESGEYILSSNNRGEDPILIEFGVNSGLLYNHKFLCQNDGLDQEVIKRATKEHKLIESEIE